MFTCGTFPVFFFFARCQMALPLSLSEREAIESLVVFAKEAVIFNGEMLQPTSLLATEDSDGTERRNCSLNIGKLCQQTVCSEPVARSQQGFEWLALARHCFRTLSQRNAVTFLDNNGIYIRHRRQGRRLEKRRLSEPSHRCEEAGHGAAGEIDERRRRRWRAY